MMSKYELVIVGGSAAGVQSAICAQKYQGLKDVLVIRPEEKAMVPCGIPYIYGTLGEVDKNNLPNKLMGDAILKIGEVVAINPDKNTVTLDNDESISYTSLILATGSNPAQPPIPGIDMDNVWVVRKNPDYLQKLADAMDKAQNIVVIGGGFIGVEFADEIRKRGLKITLIEQLDHCLQLVCTENLCEKADAVLQEGGIEVLTGNTVKSIGGNGKAEYIELSDGRKINCDLVIVGIGVVPNTKLAVDAGLEIGPTRGIKVDGYQRTSILNIFAIGDCAEKYSFFNNEPVAIRLASVATREGKIAAANIYMPQWRNVGTIGVFSTVIGNMAIAMAGLTDAQAAKMGYEVVIGEAQAASKHPGTMPDAEPMAVRLMFNRRSGELLGGCSCCTMTAGEVSNILAAAIVNRMTMEQIALFPIGTHPLLTASPLAYQITDAASNAIRKTKWD